MMFIVGVTVVVLHGFMRMEVNVLLADEQTDADERHERCGNFGESDSLAQQDHRHPPLRRTRRSV